MHGIKNTITSVYCSTLLLIITASFSCSQNNRTARLTIMANDQVHFKLISLNHYKNGIKYSNWITLHIYYNDTISGPTPFGNGWQLTFKSSTTDIEGETGLNLDPGVVEVTASGAGGPTVNYYGPIALTNTEQVIADAPVQSDGSTPYSEDVFITFSCGMQENNGMSVWDEAPDFYSTFIIFTLKAK